MSKGRELGLFAVTLAVVVAGFFAESLVGGKVLSSADVLLAEASFREVAPAGYEPSNRLLMDPALQFEPWITFNRRMIRAGRLPLWNSASGCGAPHLANGQSAVFDPFQIIAYVGTLPGAFAAMAAARLWFAGLGMFLLARSWGLGAWGRWFAGLVFPFCGFLVGWLLYPVTNVAIWMPWVFLATEAVWNRSTFRRVGGLGLAVAGTLLGGHVQTSAHLLLAAGAYAVCLTLQDRRLGRPSLLWGLGVTLGIALAAIQIVPLAVYLTKSPVWGDRDQERVAPWKLVRPRLLEAVGTAFPAIYGSQRRGEPNLARAVGADNQNESSGGYAGLATLIWLAPLAWSSRRENGRVGFLVGLTVFGAAAAIRLPGVDNLLRAIPVLKVTDNRRLTLWVAFGLVLLGGIGLDRLASFRPATAWRWWGWAWVAVAGLMVVAAVGLGRFAPRIEAKAIAHYDRMARATPGADPAEYRIRAERQTEATLRFVPGYLATRAAELLLLAGLLTLWRRERLGADTLRAILLGLTLVEVLSFEFGRNPAIDRSQYAPMTRLIAVLQEEVGRSGRVLGLGAEFPPNSLMRYGLSDPRNYDSVELRRNLDWLRPIYDPEVKAQTSRRDVSWERVVAGLDRLRGAGVRAVVGVTPPPSEFGRTERYGPVWLAWLAGAEPLISVEGPGRVVEERGGDGRFGITVRAEGPVRLVVRETFDLGWTAATDGVPAVVMPDRATFLRVDLPSGTHQIVLNYDPVEVRVAGWISGFAAIAVIFALTGILDFRSTRSVVPRLGRIQAFGLESDSVTAPRTTHPVQH